MAMPLAVTATPPLEDTFPPLTTLLEVMLEAESVETVGIVIGFKVITTVLLGALPIGSQFCNIPTVICPVVFIAVVV